MPGRPQPGGRLSSAFPLVGVYLWLCLVYLVEAWKHVTPWLFTDELEFTQLSRSLAATGHSARRGEPYAIHTLYTVLIAPFWLFHNTQTAYDAIKYFDVLLMASAFFPTYALARLVVEHRWALFAAIGATAMPALAYSSWIVVEPLAYPYAALCLYVIARTLLALSRRERRRRRWLATAIVLSALAPAMRGELIMVPFALVVALLFDWWSSAGGRARRSRWSRGDYVGAFSVVAGALIAISALLGHHYEPWYEISTYYKHRAIVLGDWAAGSLAIGLGIIPFVLGLAVLFRAPGEERDEATRIFRCVSSAALIGFGLYTAMKAAYLQNHFATRTEERNLIYIAPVLFAGTALALQRRRVHVLALLGASAYALYLICGTPLRLDVQLYSDALGTAIFQQANRYFGDPWTPSFAQWVAIGVLAVGVAAFLAAQYVRVRTAAAVAVTVVLALFIVSWNLTGEIAAAAGTISVARDEVPTLGRPFRWVDQATGGKSTIYLGQGVLDQNPEWLLEFWNRSISAVSSFDATLQGPGPSGSPNLTPDGVLYWTHDPSVPGKTFSYAVEDWPCIDFAGTRVARHLYRGGFRSLKEWRLIRLTVPNRLRAECVGIYPDTWTGPTSTYFHFSAEAPQWLRIVVSRKDWGGATGPSPVHVVYGAITADPGSHEPAMGRVLHTYHLTIDSSQTKVVWIRTTRRPFAVQVKVDKTFVPRDVDPHLSDPRELGAEVSYELVRRRPGTRHRGG